MRVQHLHSWQLSIAEARELQRRLAPQVSPVNELITPDLVAGVDISAQSSRGIARGAAVVLRYPELTVVETAIVEAELGFSYVPGLLSFREAPLILAALAKLSVTPQLILVDGQGIAHPRRLGLASHLGIFAGLPTVGCAKSILCGRHGPLSPEIGSQAELVDNGEVVGAALRTRSGVKPVYVSIGHKVDLPTAIYWVMQCCRGYRLPEPCRLAHLAAGGRLPAGVSPHGRLLAMES